MRVSVRDTTALAVGSAASGLLAYVFFALSTRTLGAVEAAPVSVLWTYWTFAGAALTFPLQHWIARTAAANDGEAGLRAAMPRVAALVTATAVLAAGLSWLIRTPLFGRDDPGFPVLVGLITLGSGLVGILRGGLSARRRFTAVATAMVLENGLRCVAAAVLVVAGVESALTVGVCMAAGALLCLAWPSALRFRREGPMTAAGSPLRFLSGASGGQLLAQAVLTGGPVLLALSGGDAADVTALFVALALFRAPYMLAIGLVAPLTGRLTVLFVQGRHAELRRVRLLVLGGTVLTTGAAGLIGALVGPALLQLIFGDQVHLSSYLTAIVAVGSATALTSLVMTVMILAQSRSSAVARAWAVAALAGAGVFALLPSGPLPRTCWAFVTAEVVALVALVVEELRGSARGTADPDGQPSPPGTEGQVGVPG
jgi:O-antigen/teichoic acid export membrane protein